MNLHLLHALRIREDIWLLTLLVHALLRRHRIAALGLLLLLKIGLILQGLLVVGGHVRLLGSVARHAALGHALRHRRCGAVGFFWRVDGGVSVHAVGIRGFWCIETCLQRRQYK